MNMTGDEVDTMQKFSDKTLLITGGTGSFGHAVLDRFIDDFGEIRIFSRDEKKQDDMRHELQNPRVKFYIGDVRDRQSVDGVMRGVDYVFSAAALKQVPSCEFFPMQADTPFFYRLAIILRTPTLRSTPRPPRSATPPDRSWEYKRCGHTPQPFLRSIRAPRFR